MPLNRKQAGILLIEACGIVGLLLAPSTLLALDPAKELNRYSRQTWRTESGLPQNTVHSILQTRDGFLWLATEGGVARFDGQKFTTFTTEQGLPSDKVWSLHEDRSGKLWVITSDGSADFREDHFERSRPPEQMPSGESSPLPAITDRLPSNRIASSYLDRDGTAWIGTDRGLVRIRDGNVERFPANDPLSTSIVISIFEDREGNLWLGTDSEGLTVLRDSKFVTYSTRDGLPNEFVRCIFQDHRGTLWAGTDAGLARFDGSRFSILTAKEGLSSNVILSLGEDAPGNLLVGTPDGLNVLGPHGIRVVTSADGLADDFIRSIYKDIDGSVWIGTRRGLSYWSSTGFKTYSQTDGLGSDFVGAVLREREGDLWVGTLRGLTSFKNGRFRTYTTKDGLSSNVITALHEDSRGVLWIGTQDGGLNRLERDKIFRYSSSSGLPEVIYAIVEDQRQNLWLTSKTGIFRVSREQLDAFAFGHKADLSVASYGVADGLIVSECSGAGHPAAWKSRDGALWFATLKGLATADPQRAGSFQLAPPVVLESVSIDDRLFSPSRARDVAPGHARFAFEYAGLSFLAPHSVRFKYKLEGFDPDWIDAGTRRIAYYTNIPPGRYRFRVVARNNEGLWNQSDAFFAFRLQPRFYQTYWFDSLLLCALALLAWQTYRWRVKQVQAQFDAVLAERIRIAREIHDTLAQGFVALSVQLELISRTLSSSKERAQDLLKQAQQSVQNSLADARRSIWELRSQSSNTEDLPSKFSKIAAQVSSTSAIKAQFQVFGTRRPLPSNIENELLKIGQEAVTNAVRHANAKHVKIDLSFEPKKLMLAITDDGRGFESEFDTSGPDGHFGLRGMRERAEQIDADLSVKSVPGIGTQILIQAEID